MKINSLFKKFTTVGLAAALVVSGITYQPNLAKAAAETPVVTVLGATLSLDAEDGKQSMRVAIQVENADKASSCGMDITYGTKTLTFSTDTEGQNKLYDADVENNKVVYAVKIANIPSENFANDFTIKGFATAIGESEPEVSTEETRSVDSVVEAISAKDANVTMKSGKLVSKIASLDIISVGSLPSEGNNCFVANCADGSSTVATYDEVNGYAVVKALNSEEEEVPFSKWGIAYRNTTKYENVDWVAEVTVDDSTGLKMAPTYGDSVPFLSSVENAGWTTMYYKIPSVGWYWSYGLTSDTVSSYNLKEFNLYKVLTVSDIGDTKLIKNINVVLSEENEAQHDNIRSITYNNDGSVDVTLAYDNCGGTIAYYINADKSDINWDNYVMVMNITSDGSESYPMCYQGCEYWPSIAPGTNDYVFDGRFTGTTNKIVIKYNNWSNSGNASENDISFRINSIKFIKK